MGKDLLNRNSIGCPLREDRREILVEFLEPPCERFPRGKPQDPGIQDPRPLTDAVLKARVPGPLKAWVDPENPHEAIVAVAAKRARDSMCALDDQHDPRALTRNPLCPRRPLRHRDIDAVGNDFVEGDHFVAEGHEADD